MRKDNRVAYMFLLPMISIMLGLVVYPVARTFIYSLKEYKLTEPENTKFIGLKNYKDVLLSTGFRSALLNTLVVILVVVILGFILSIVVALIINRKSKLNGFLTAIAIIPWALPPVVNGIIWRFIFYPGYGLINKLLITLKVVDIPVNWLSSRYETLIIVGIIVVWRVVPFGAIVLMTNMQSIPRDIYEAAEVDGANKFNVFKEITLPLLVPSIAIILINLTMNSVNVFDEIISLVGYRNISETLLIYNYTETFSFLNFGYGSAITYVIMLLSGLYGYFYITNLSKQGEKI